MKTTTTTLPPATTPKPTRQTKRRRKQTTRPATTKSTTLTTQTTPEYEYYDEDEYDYEEYEYETEPETYGSEFVPDPPSNPTTKPPSTRDGNGGQENAYEQPDFVDFPESKIRPPASHDLFSSGNYQSPVIGASATSLQQPEIKPGVFQNPTNLRLAPAGRNPPAQMTWNNPVPPQNFPAPNQAPTNPPVNIQYGYQNQNFDTQQNGFNGPMATLQQSEITVHHTSCNTSPCYQGSSCINSYRDPGHGCKSRHPSTR